jgi:hypothetical protein
LWCIKDFKRFTEITTNYVFPPFEKVKTTETTEVIVPSEPSKEPSSEPSKE